MGKVILKELIDKVDVHPKVSLLVTIVCLIFVLANNHIYMTSLQEREKRLREEEAKVELREAGNNKKERMMRLWELELLSREKDLTKLLEDIKARSRAAPKPS